MAADKIEREIIVEASQERVWAVLTEAEHVAKWFGDSARMDLAPGGKAAFGWSQYDDSTHHAMIERVEPPGFFSYRWARPAGEPVTPGNSTLVEFTLTAAGPGTRLRVVETGFTGLDVSEEERGTAVKENIEGWRTELGELKDYAEQSA